MSKQQSKQLKPVTRDATGKLKSGTPNPGGLTSDQRQARDALSRWLCESPQIEAGKKAYLRLLNGDDETPPNPVIVKDFMDRVAGKVKEHVELSGDAMPPDWLRGLTAAAVLAIARGETPDGTD